MARPCKSRTLQGVPRPVLYIPSGWTQSQMAPSGVAIEDFEVMRLVDGHAHSVEEAAQKVGVARSTAGRMLERARRAIVLGFERRAPIFVDAAEATVLEPPKEIELRQNTSRLGNDALFAIAVTENSMDSVVARIFGRADSFALVGENNEVRFIPNPGAGVQRDAARVAATALKDHGVKQVVAGRFGPEALQRLGKAAIEPVVAIDLKLRQAVELFSVVTK